MSQITIMNQNTKKMLMKFYMKDKVMESVVEDALTESEVINNIILGTMVECIGATFKNNSSVIFNNFSCHGSNILRI